MNQLSDKELIKAIKTGGGVRQGAIRQIYTDKGLRNKVIHFVQQNSGNQQDGQDMFHEGIIVLDRNIRQEKFRGESTISLYLYSTCRFLWMNQIRKKAKVDLKENNQQMDGLAPENPEMDLMNAEKKQALKKVLSQLGERCQKILELWRLSFSMEEIAQKLGFSSSAMARKNKYRCHQSLMKYLKENPEWMEMLK